MQLHPHRFAECKNESCRRRIWLPHSSLLGTDINPPSLHSAKNPQTFACPTCGHAPDYRQPHNLPDLSPQADQYLRGVLRLATVEFRCGIENCEARVRIHTPAETGQFNAQDSVLRREHMSALATDGCGLDHIDRLRLSITLPRISGTGTRF